MVFSTFIGISQKYIFQKKAFSPKISDFFRTLKFGWVLGKGSLKSLYATRDLKAYDEAFAG